MEALNHPPTSIVGIEQMGVNPKHPEYSSTEFHEHHDPIRIMEHSKQIMEEWNTIVVPKIMPRVNALVHHVTDLKYQTDAADHSVRHDDNDRIRTLAELKTLFDETIAIEAQLQQLYDPLRTGKQQMCAALRGNPLCTKYLSSISQCPIFGRVTPKLTADQVTLDHYYQHEYLHQYETATIEYQTVSDQCQHILLLISNTRTSWKS